MKNYLIKNGTIYDGSAKPPFIGDILVRDGIIEKISADNINPTSDCEIIDAQGKWVVPGFIDNHTHYDGEVLVAPTLEESVRHGVTTVMLGGCSLSFVCADVEDCCDMFTRVEAFPREVLYPILSKEKTWQTPSEWIAHKKMSSILSDALDEGFVGISMQHNPWDKMDGRHWSKLLPAAYAKKKERKALVKVVRERGAHLQGVPNLVNRVGALWYMLQSAGFLWRKKLKTSMVALMDLKGDPLIRPVVSKLSAFFNRGLGADFRMQLFAVPFRVMAEGMELVIFEEFPTGQMARHLSRDTEERNKLINDADYRKRFKKNIKSKFTPKVWQKDFGDAYVVDAPDKMDKDILWETTVGNHDPNRYKPHYNDPNGVIGFADSGAHINNMAFYNFPLRVLRYVKASHDKGDPIMPIEKAIWRLTKENADFFNIDAGHLAEGKRADITVIDPSQLDDRVHEYHKADFLHACDRLVNRNDDVVSLVMINGKVAWEEGNFSASFGQERFGDFLRANHTHQPISTSGHVHAEKKETVSV